MPSTCTNTTMAAAAPSPCSRFADAEEKPPAAASVQEEQDDDEEDRSDSDSDVGDALDWLDAAEGRPSAAFSSASAARRPNAHGGVLSRNTLQPLSNRTQKLASRCRADPLEVCYVRSSNSAVPWVRVKILGSKIHSSLQQIGIWNEPPVCVLLLRACFVHLRPVASCAEYLMLCVRFQWFRSGKVDRTWGCRIQ